MKLYLIQHAEAFSAEIDPERALTPSGLRAVHAMGQWVARRRINVPELWHSEKLRALQTAECLARHLAPAGRIDEHPGLNPKDEIPATAKEVNRRTADLAIIGHLPHLSKLAAFLVTGQEEPSIVDFQMAGIVCLGRSDKSSWRLCWMLIPDLLGE